MTLRKRLRIVLPLIVIAAAAAYFGFSRNGGPGGVLLLSGNIEVTDARVGFKIAGRLLERLVDEGVEVAAGQQIARLDPTDQELQVSRAAAELKAAEASLAELEAGSRPEEIRRAHAQLEQARQALRELETGNRAQEVAESEAEHERALAAEKAALAELELARADRERAAELFRKGIVSTQENDVVRTRHDAALNAQREATARVKSAAERLSLMKEGSRAERIAQARAAAEQAEATYALVKEGPRAEAIQVSRAQAGIWKEALRQARQQLEYTRLAAPFAGTVLSKAAEPGEYLQPGSPVVTIGDLEHPWVRAYVDEADLGRVLLGEAAEVTVDTFPGRVFKGHVSFLAGEAEFTPKPVQTFRERAKLVYRVKIDVENPDRVLKPGMPADARIRVGSP